MNECRICLESGDVNDLISPCNCNGSSQWVHSKCLQEWRNQNVNPNSRNQCEICLFTYIITYEGTKETFFIKKMYYTSSFFEFFFSLFITFVLGHVAYIIDSNLNFKSFKDLNLEYMHIQFHENNDKWFIWIYYQGLVSFILNVAFYTIINLMSYHKIHRKKHYFYKMAIQNIITFIYSFNFLILILISELTKSPGILSFWSPLFVSFHISIMTAFIENHNKLLNSMNEILGEGVINSFQLNPLNEYVPLTIEDVDENEEIPD